LEAVGYRMRRESTVWQIVTQGGGQYVVHGACDPILEGKIKIKSDTHIEKFTETGLRFQDGTDLAADVVILATGYGDLRVPIRRVVDEAAGKKLTKIWGVNEEGETNSQAKEIGIPGLWFISGNLAFSRSIWLYKLRPNRWESTPNATLQLLSISVNTSIL